MPRRLAPLPPELLTRPFTVAQARAAGVTGWRVGHPSLHAPFRGMRTSTPARAGDVVGRCLELLPLLPATAVFSHATALDLHRVDRPLGLRRPDDLHVQVPEGVGRPRWRGVVGHTWAPPQIPTRSVFGVPVLPVELVWVRLAAELTDRELVVVGDALLRRTSALTTLDALRRAVATLSPGTRGIRRLRTALDRLRPRTDSCMETRLRWAIVQSGLPEPEVNPVLRTRTGAVVMPDLAYLDARIAVEYDGDVHRTDRATWRRDIARRQIMESAGWRTITCTADDIHRPDRALAWIRKALLDRDALPPSRQKLSPPGPL